MLLIRYKTTKASNFISKSRCEINGGIEGFGRVYSRDEYVKHVFLLC